MSIKVTVTLDEDVLERVKRERAARGSAFNETLNDLLRSAFLHLEQKPSGPTLKIKPEHMGFRAGLNYDSVESLLRYEEDGQYR